MLVDDDQLNIVGIQSLRCDNESLAFFAQIPSEDSRSI
jgi:hypothetical protein